MVVGAHVPPVRTVRCKSEAIRLSHQDLLSDVLTWSCGPHMRAPCLYLESTQKRIDCLDYRIKVANVLVRVMSYSFIIALP